MNRVSASWLERAMACAASVSLPQEDDRARSDAAARGTAIHAYIAGMLCCPQRSVEIPEQYTGICGKVDIDAARDVFSGYIVRTEVSYAYDVATGEAREIGEWLDRSYGELAKSEITCTIDAHSVDGSVVWDWKTGYNRSTPAVNNWQVRLAALCVASVQSRDEVRVGIGYVDTDGSLDTSDTAVFDALDLASFAAEIRAGYAKWVSGSIVTEPGDHCRYCRSKAACPIFAATSEYLETTLVPNWLDRFRESVTVDTHAAEAWERLPQLEAILSAYRDALEERVKRSPIPLPDGSKVAYCEGPSRRSVRDAESVYTTISSVAGAEVADLAAPARREASIASIKAACKMSGTDERAVMTKLETVGAVGKSSSFKLKVIK